MKLTNLSTRKTGATLYDGLYTYKEYIVEVERVKNTYYGNPNYRIKVYDEEGEDVLRNWKYNKYFTRRLLKGNAVSISSYDLAGSLKEFIDKAIEKMDK